MMAETTPRTSAKWRAHETFSSRVGLVDGKLNKDAILKPEIVEDVKAQRSAA